MKKLLLIVLALLVLGAGALAVFIATFDADRYRPMLVQEAQRALGKAVELQRIKLAWDGGVAVQLQGLALYDTPQPSGEPLLRVDTVSALVQLMPLLQKRVEIASVRVSHPYIRVVRDAQGRLNLTALAAMGSPAAAQGQTVSAPTGQSLSFDIDKLLIEDGTVRYEDAAAGPASSVELKRIDATLRNLSLAGPIDVDLQATFGAAEPNIHVKGRFTPPSASFEGAVEGLDFRAERLSLDELLPAGRPGEPSLGGHASVSLSGSVPSLDPARLMDAVSGTGKLAAQDLRIKNLNLLRAVFERFSMIPGLAQTLQDRLPPEYQAKFQASDTAFQPFDVSTSVSGGVAELPQFDISTDVLTLSGSGRVRLNGVVELRTLLRIDPTLSEAIFRSVQELRPLANAQGQLEIPVLIAGPASGLSVQPDVQYLAAKVITTKAVDLINSLIQKHLAPEEQAAPGAEGAPQAAPAPPEGAAAPPQATEGDLLNALLQRALQGKKQEQPSQ